MRCSQDYIRPAAFIAWLAVLVLWVALLTACAPKAIPLPPPAPEALPIYIPIAKPCEVEKVEKSPLPSAAGVPDDIFEAVKRVLADREVLIGDREKLVASNSDPCPEPKDTK